MAESRPKTPRFIWERLDKIEQSILELKRGIEIVAQQTVVRQSELESIKYQVAALAEGQVELENRIEKLEKNSTLISWGFRQLATILLVIVAAYIASIWF
jgi:chromosome segregation ATPase